VQPEKKNLADAPEVQDVVALLDALVSPAHDLSLARALKSPLFGVPDDALVQLAAQARRAGAKLAVSWFDLLQKEERLTQPLRRGLGAGREWQGWVAALAAARRAGRHLPCGDVPARFAAAAPAHAARIGAGQPGRAAGRGAADGRRALSHALCAGAGAAQPAAPARPRWPARVWCACSPCMAPRGWRRRWCCCWTPTAKRRRPRPWACWWTGRAKTPCPGALPFWPAKAAARLHA
jgi:hypothetical protein